MAGVPSIFQAMLDNVVPTLKTGTKLLSATIPCPLGEGVIGGPLGEIQKAHPDTIIGSYPKYLDGTFWTELVVRARTQEALDAARADVEAMVAGLAAQQLRRPPGARASAVDRQAARVLAAGAAMLQRQETCHVLQDHPRHHPGQSRARSGSAVAPAPSPSASAPI